VKQYDKVLIRIGRLRPERPPKQEV